MGPSVPRLSGGKGAAGGGGGGGGGGGNEDKPVGEKGRQSEQSLYPCTQATVSPAYTAAVFLGAKGSGDPNTKCYFLKR